MTDDEMLVFTNEPLKPSKTTVTLSIVSEENGLRGDALRGEFYGLPERMEMEGQITLNPGGRIFYIPPFDSTESEPLLMPDRGKWDLYLVYLPFTLHPAPGSPEKAHYEEVTFFVDLVTPDARAFDLFPADIFSEVEVTKTYTLSPQCTFKELGVSLGQVSRQIQFKGLHPVISAFGKDEHKFYWIHQGFREQNVVIPETKHAAVVLQVPRGTPWVQGTISYHVKIVKKMIGGFRAKDGKVDKIPMRWDLQDAPPLFKVAAIQSKPTIVAPVVDATLQGRLARSTVASHFDVCLFCALPEEAQECIGQIERLCGVTFQPGTSTHTGPYRYATIQDKQGEPLTVRVSWQLGPGPVEAGLLMRPVLEECTPYFAAMTGICAGDKRKVQFGDLVVANSAYTYDTGKIVIGNDGKSQLLHELESWNASPDALQYALMFQGWEAAVAGIARPVVQQPVSQVSRQQTDGERQLPQVHIAPVASGYTVRGDNPFEEICLFVRDTAGLDMEAVAFYRTVAGFPNVRSLFVKGISDYADGNKDDSYHHYASAASAAYIVSFIKEFVTSDRFA